MTTLCPFLTRWKQHLLLCLIGIPAPPDRLMPPTTSNAINNPVSTSISHPVSYPASHRNGTVPSMPPATAIQGTPRHCDLFCTVIDNFGDAAVCWRLARQLARERGWQVRLFIDQPEALAALRGVREAPPGEADEYILSVSAPGAVGSPEVPFGVGARNFAGTGAIHVAPWPSDTAAWHCSDVGDVVIEAFACTLPAGFIAAMAERPTPPVWINLEYLSAEDWVQGCHLGRSPHPRLALTKTFFFPGLVEGTGGLLREHDLHSARQHFLHDIHAQNDLWSRLQISPPPARTARGLIITLFAYENPAVESLLDQWSDASLTPLDGAETVTLIVPVGRISPQVATYLGQSCLAVGAAVQRGRLSVHAVPFVSQDDYDRLLWLADINFVRGEDSFVRAQWAEHPFVWQIYPQAEEAHMEKLDAALALYLAPLPDATRNAVRHFWHAWNLPILPAPPSTAVGAVLPSGLPSASPADGPSAPVPASTRLVPDWIAFWQHHAVLRKHAAPWAAALQCPGSLSANLADFVESQLK